MKRGEIWTLQDDGYASKARPVVIVQSDLVGGFDSVVLSLLTTFDAPLAFSRVKIEPDKANGLKQVSYVMTEKLVTVRRADLGYKVGELSEACMHEVARRLVQVLGITGDDI